MRYSFYYDQLDDVMYDFLRTCCNCWDFDHLLENFTQGVGCLLNEIGIAFADDPDENDPTQIRDFPELEGFEGVEIYCNFGDEIMVGYQKFYDALELYVFDHIKNKDQNYRDTMIGYLKKIKQRYHLKGYTGKKDFQEFFQYLETERMYQIQEKASAEAIDQLVESVYPARLPAAYLEFMRYTGTGEYWKGAKYAIHEVPSLRETAEKILDRYKFPQKLQKNDFVFWIHENENMFYFFRLDEGDNPAVYCYRAYFIYYKNNNLEKFEKCGESFVDFIIDPYINRIPNF